MEQEHENESTKTGFNTNAISIVLSAVDIFSSYGGVFLKSPALKSLSYVVVFILLIVVSYPSLFCKTKTVAIDPMVQREAINLCTFCLVN